MRYCQCQENEIKALTELASQFNLLNLPGDYSVIEEFVHRSIDSFAGKLPKEKAQYIFALKEMESNRLVGTSMIIAKHGTPETPHLSFAVSKKEKFSHDLGIGFIHRVLQFKENIDGPTEIGGLLIDRGFSRKA